MSEPPSSNFKKISRVGISLGSGLVLGILAVVSYQYFESLSNRADHDFAQNDIQQDLSLNGDYDSSETPVVVKKFEEIFNQRSTSEQYKTLYNILSRTTEHELKEWWIQSKKIERTSQREIAQQVIIQNLTKINPQVALRYLHEASLLQKDALSRTIFREWAALNLDAAIEAAAKLVGARRNVALEAILETRDDLAEDKRRAIAIQLKRIDTYDKLKSKTKVLHSIANPSESWNTLLKDNVDNSRQMRTLAIVAESWRELIGYEVLSKIYHSGIEEDEIKQLLTAVIPQMDLVQAMEYAHGVSEENERFFLSRIIVEEWATTDPLSALAGVSSFKPTSLYFDLEEAIAVGWAKNKPSELIQSIELLSEGSRVWPLEVAFAYLTREDPLGAINSLRSMEDSVGNTSTILHRIIEQWGMLHPEAATNWLLNDFDQEDPFLLHSLLEETLPSLALQDPKEAFEIALQQPTPAHALAFPLHLRVIWHLTRHSNVEQAISLLPRVREDSKASAYESVASALVDKGQALEALEMGSDLNPQQQQRYYGLVFQQWAWTNPTDLYEALEDLPSNDAQSLQSFAALELLTRRFSRDQVLTDDQLERARSFLNSEHREGLEAIEMFEN